MSLKNFARIIANCPEKTPKLCADDSIHTSDPSYLDTLKYIMPGGTYDMKGFDYTKNAAFDGTLNVIHDDSNSIQLDSKFTFDGSTSIGVPVLRSGKISTDSTGRTYYSSTTKKPHGEQFAARKNMKCVSKNGDSVTWLGYGSSTSTEKYHCGTNIKKVFTKIGNDSFSIETHLDGKKAYVCNYKQR